MIASFRMRGIDGFEKMNESKQENSHLTSLNSNHNLMRCYQESLKSHLHEQLEKTNLELIKKKNLLKEKLKERKDLGTRLYDEQERLVSGKDKLQSLNNKYQDIFCQYQDDEKQLLKLREHYEKLTTSFKEEKKIETNLQHQIEKLDKNLIHVTHVGENISSHSEMVKTIREKSEKDKNVLVYHQLQQDIQIYQQQKILDKLKAEIVHYKQVIEIQKNEKKEMEEHISEADIEIKSINLEFKHLLAQWKTGLFSLSRKEEALVLLKKMMSDYQGQLQLLKAEKNKYKKSIQQELELNEQLTLLGTQRNKEVCYLSKIKQKLDKEVESLYQVYSFLKTAISEMESNYQQIDQEMKLEENKFHKIMESMQKEKMDMNSIQSSTRNLMHEKLSADRNSKNICLMNEKLQDEIKKMDVILLEEESTLNKQTSQLNDVKLNCESLKKQLEELESNAEEMNSECNIQEQEMKELDSSIKSKQKILDELKQKLEIPYYSEKGSNICVLKNEESRLMSDIDALEFECIRKEKDWLQLQYELMNLNNQSNNLTRKINEHNSHFAIYERKNSQIEGEIKQQKKEIISKEHIIQNYQNDIVRLNMLLKKEKSAQGDLVQESLFKKNDYMEKLKELELECVQQENMLNNLKNKNTEIHDEIMKTEKESLVWADKIQQIEETRKFLKNDLYLDVKSLKAEIHLKTLQQNNFKKDQETLQRELEKAVYHYAMQWSKLEMRDQLSNLKKDNKDSLQRQEDNVKRKINQLKKNCELCEQQEHETEAEKLKLNCKIEDYENHKINLELQINSRIKEIEIRKKEKYKNIMKLSLMQQKTKHYEDIKTGKYLVLAHSDEKYELELKNSRQRLSVMKTIAEKLNEEFPSLGDKINRILIYIECADIL